MVVSISDRGDISLSVVINAKRSYFLCIVSQYNIMMLPNVGTRVSLRGVD